MNKFDWIMLMGIVIIMLVGVFGIIFYFNYENGKCVSNPFVYGSKVLADKYEVEVIGSIILLNTEGKNFPIIKFNSKEIEYLK